MEKYQIIFDDMCPGWSRNPEETLAYLRSIEKELNEIFSDEGHLYLKDALNLMGIACPFPEGIGWWYESDPLPWDHENYISLGIYDIEQELNRRFVNGLDTRCCLTFNVHGDLTQYYWDMSIVIGGPELAQDLFDYPWLHHSGLAIGGQYWDS